MTGVTVRRGVAARQVSRRAVQAEITTCALRLFAAQGFDATTVDQIAAASGVSSRSLFRYFTTKEDIVIGDAASMGELLASLLAGRSEDEPAGMALRNAMVEFMATAQQDRARSVQLSRLMVSTPALRARHLEKQQLWLRLLLPETLSRLGPASLSLRATALVSTALACLDVVVLEWAASDGTPSLADLLDVALEAVTTELPHLVRAPSGLDGD